MKKVLFVCLGNICRSAMAKYVFEDMLEKAGMSHLFEVDSAGTSDEEHGNPIYPPARKKLAENGIWVGGHSARQISKGDYRYFDYLVAMDTNNLRDLMRVYDNDPDGKISLLLDHTSPVDREHHHRSVADPWFTRNFDQAYEDIVVGCRALLEEWC